MTLTPTHRAAGIAFRTKSGEALFLKRGPLGDYPGYWCFPGGHQEANEDAEAAAKREAVEEVGFLPKGKLELASRSVMVQEVPAPAGATDGAAGGVSALSLPAAPEVPKVVDYVTFSLEVPEPFEPERDREHIGHAWAPLTSPPEPLHPGTRIAIDRMLADELGVARMMAAGTITSPQRYRNVTLWAMRITGTGLAYRMPVFKKDKDGEVVLGKDGKSVLEREEEFPWRDPAIYLNEEFLARCNGLPVIWKHPDGATLDSKEFENRNVGSIFLPFIMGDEVWGIAKVFDDEANAVLAEGTKEGKDWSTSPGVVLSDPNNPSYKFRLEDGSLLLVEGKPSLLDHIAICERGVWDKGGEPAGIINDSLEEIKRMTDKTDVKTEPTMADVLAAIGAVGQRVDTIGVRVDAIEKEKKDAFPEDLKKDAEEKAKADAEEKERKDAEEKAKADAEDEEKKKADAEDEEKKKADAEACAEKVAADAKKDAEEAKKDSAALRVDNEGLRKRIAAVEAKLPQDRSDDDHRSMTAAQVRADSVYELFGKKAPRFQTGETNGEYRRRLIRDFAEHSPTWKAVDVGALADSAFAVAEEQIYNDAASAAKNATGVEDGGLRMVPGTTASGHKKVEFFGRPGAWMGRFAGARRYATSINPNTKREAI